MNNAALEYLSNQQASRQWKGFLGAFAEVLSDELPVTELQNLLRRVGTRFAQQMELGVCRTLDDLQLAMSRVWVDIDWGWVALDQQEDHLRIRHHCAPLRAAFGAHAVHWTPAFLEGVYQEWFLQIQAGEALHVRQVTAPDESGSIELRLGRL